MVVDNIVRLTVEPAEARVAPGENLVVSLIVHNPRNKADGYRIDVVGIPSTWCDLRKSRVALMPGDREHIHLSIRPPAGAASPGNYTITVRVRAEGDPTNRTATELALQVVAPEPLAAPAEPAQPSSPASLAEAAEPLPEAPPADVLPADDAAPADDAVLAGDAVPTPVPAPRRPAWLRTRPSTLALIVPLIVVVVAVVVALGAAGHGQVGAPQGSVQGAQRSHAIHGPAYAVVVHARPLTVTLRPRRLHLGARPTGSPAVARTVRVVNDGPIPLRIKRMALRGANRADFAISTNRACTGVIHVPDACIITVRFTPHARGPRRAELAIWDNAKGSPQHLALSGTGR